MKSVCLLLHGRGKIVDDGDRVVAEALRAQGLDVQWAGWDTPGIYFDRFTLVLVRTCYGYHHSLPKFLHWLQQADRAGTKLVNGAKMIQWNSDKRYLRSLHDAGIPTVPTQWIEAGAQPVLAEVMAQQRWAQAVVKPVVSAGSENTFRVDAAAAAAHQAQFAQLCRERGMMVQPFLAEIETAGELSLIFVNGALSHCIRKVPRAGDFRSQPEFGSAVTDAQAPDSALKAAMRCLASLDETPLYARVDGVMTASGFALMELELIEPNLYLSGRTQATQAYVDAILQRL